MEKLYGFKKQDVIGLYSFIKERKGESLTSVFSRYANSTGKSKGTIRNLYYTISKVSLEDKDFCNTYLDGKPLTVIERKEFLPCQERALLKQILIKKGDGVSVRKAVKELAKKDEKLALRFQNKYRGLIKNNKSLVKSVIDEIKEKNKNFNVNIEKKEVCFNKVQVIRLKQEINSLFERTFTSLKKENLSLKEENNRLKSLLLLGDKDICKNFFSKENKEDLLS